MVNAKSRLRALACSRPRSTSVTRRGGTAFTAFGLTAAVTSAIRTGRTALAAATLAAALLAGCASTDKPATPDPRQPASGTDIVAALAVGPEGVLTGALRSGIVRVLRSGRVVARVAVSTGGQRGLLGLAADRRGRIFAAYTAPDRRLVVDRIAPAPRRRIFDGPRSALLGNGGHITLAPGGRLLLGIGDLGHTRLIDDPQTLNGKLVSLDVDGPPSQRPRVLSGGWHKPFAFDVDRSGRVWVADNAPGRLAERIGRGDRDGAITTLRGRRAPSGLALLSDRELALCGVVSGRLERFRRSGADGPWRSAGTIAGGCRYGVVRLTALGAKTTRLAVSADGVRLVTP